MAYHRVSSHKLNEFLADQAGPEPVEMRHLSNVYVTLWGGEGSMVKAISLYDDKGICLLALLWED